MRKDWLLIGAAIALAGLLVFAWIDGGERPLSPIAQPVNLPGATQ